MTIKTSQLLVQNALKEINTISAEKALKDMGFEKVLHIDGAFSSIKNSWLTII